MSKIAVIYAYYEKTPEYRKNLDFFVKIGIYIDDENVDYYFVVNGHTDYAFPQKKNVKVFYRENVGFDFAGYNFGIQEIEKTDKFYDYYFFMNTSCRGPFMPEYCKNMKWFAPFIQLFEKDDNIKLVGSTINPLTWSFIPHVQSYLFALNEEGLNYVKTSGVFKKQCGSIKEVADNQEVELSLAILRNGWNISCLIPEYQNINYAQAVRDLNEGGNYSAITLNNKTFHCTGTSGDITFPGNKCFGRDIHPYEVIFIKIYRGCSPDQINSITNYYNI